MPRYTVRIEHDPDAQDPTTCDGAWIAEYHNLFAAAEKHGNVAATH
jgi:hypothetical protein